MTLTAEQRAALERIAAEQSPIELPSHRSLRSPAAWPEPAGPDAFHGLAGQVVQTIEPHSEADPHAVLVQFLVAFGNAAGRTAGFTAESTFHATNLNALIVGPTSKARKGSAWNQSSRPVALADAPWQARVVSGLSSGEGLIHAVRDPVETRRKARKAEQGQADAEGYVTELTDEGESDKRALAFEPEFASVLRVMRRDGSTLSAVIRQAWESDRLRTLTRNSPLRATGAHISIVGHISQEELRRELLTTDAASGFANRFLFCCARRSKQLPEGGSLTDDDWQTLVPKVRQALRFAGTVKTLKRDDEARALWAEVYSDLSAGRPGLFGAVTSRAEAQVMRLAVIYALLDCSAEVRAVHLRAALALWRYCSDSARYLFGHALGDDTADALLAAFVERGDAGMTRTAIRDHFGRHKSAADLDRALTLLESLGLAERGKRSTGGRPTEIWRVSCDKSDRSDESEVWSHTSLLSQQGPSGNGSDPLNAPSPNAATAKPCCGDGPYDADSICIKCGRAP